MTTARPDHSQPRPIAPSATVQYAIAMARQAARPAAWANTIIARHTGPRFSPRTMLFRRTDFTSRIGVTPPRMLVPNAPPMLLLHRVEPQDWDDQTATFDNQARQKTLTSELPRRSSRSTTPSRSTRSRTAQRTVAPTRSSSEHFPLLQRSAAAVPPSLEQTPRGQRGTLGASQRPISASSAVFRRFEYHPFPDAYEPAGSNPSLHIGTRSATIASGLLQRMGIVDHGRPLANVARAQSKLAGFVARDQPLIQPLRIAAAVDLDATTASTPRRQDIVSTPNQQRSGSTRRAGETGAFPLLQRMAATSTGSSAIPTPGRLTTPANMPQGAATSTHPGPALSTPLGNGFPLLQRVAATSALPATGRLTTLASASPAASNARGAGTPATALFSSATRSTAAPLGWSSAQTTFPLLQRIAVPSVAPAETRPAYQGGASSQRPAASVPQPRTTHARPSLGHAAQPLSLLRTRTVSPPLQQEARHAFTAAPRLAQHLPSPEHQRPASLPTRPVQSAIVPLVSGTPYTAPTVQRMVSAPFAPVTMPHPGTPLPLTAQAVQRQAATGRTHAATPSASPTWSSLPLLHHQQTPPPASTVSTDPSILRQRLPSLPADTRPSTATLPLQMQSNTPAARQVPDVGGRQPTVQRVADATARPALPAVQRDISQPRTSRLDTPWTDPRILARTVQPTAQDRPAPSSATAQAHAPYVERTQPTMLRPLLQSMPPFVPLQRVVQPATGSNTASLAPGQAMLLSRPPSDRATTPSLAGRASARPERTTSAPLGGAFPLLQRIAATSTGSNAIPTPGRLTTPAGTAPSARAAGTPATALFSSATRSTAAPLGWSSAQTAFPLLQRIAVPSVAPAETRPTHQGGASSQRPAASVPQPRTTHARPNLGHATQPLSLLRTRTVSPPLQQEARHAFTAAPRLAQHLPSPEHQRPASLLTRPVQSAIVPSVSGTPHAAPTVQRMVSAPFAPVAMPHPGTPLPLTAQAVQRQAATGRTHAAAPSTSPTWSSLPLLHRQQTPPPASTVSTDPSILRQRLPSLPADTRPSTATLPLQMQSNTPAARQVPDVGGRQPTVQRVADATARPALPAVQRDISQPRTSRLDTPWTDPRILARTVQPTAQDRPAPRSTASQAQAPYVERAQPTMLRPLLQSMPPFAPLQRVAQPTTGSGIASPALGQRTAPTALGGAFPLLQRIAATSTGSSPIPTPRRLTTPANMPQGAATSARPGPALSTPLGNGFPLLQRVAATSALPATGRLTTSASASSAAPSARRAGTPATDRGAPTTPRATWKASAPFSLPLLQRVAMWDASAGLAPTLQRTTSQIGLGSSEPQRRQPSNAASFAPPATAQPISPTQSTKQPLVGRSHSASIARMLPDTLQLVRSQPVTLTSPTMGGTSMVDHPTIARRSVQSTQSSMAPTIPSSIATVGRRGHETTSAAGTPQTSERKGISTSWDVRAIARTVALLGGPIDSHRMTGVPGAGSFPLLQRFVSPDVVLPENAQGQRHSTSARVGQLSPHLTNAPSSLLLLRTHPSTAPAEQADSSRKARTQAAGTQVRDRAPSASPTGEQRRVSRSTRLPSSGDGSQHGLRSAILPTLPTVAPTPSIARKPNALAPVTARPWPLLAGLPMPDVAPAHWGSRTAPTDGATQHVGPATMRRSSRDDRSSAAKGIQLQRAVTASAPSVRPYQAGPSILPAVMQHERWGIPALTTHPALTLPSQPLALLRTRLDPQPMAMDERTIPTMQRSTIAPRTRGLARATRATPGDAAGQTSPILMRSAILAPNVGASTPARAVRDSSRQREMLGSAVSTTTLPTPLDWSALPLVQRLTVTQTLTQAAPLPQNVVRPFATTQAASIQRSSLDTKGIDRRTSHQSTITAGTQPALGLLVATPFIARMTDPNTNTLTHPGRTSPLLTPSRRRDRHHGDQATAGRIGNTSSISRLTAPPQQTALGRARMDRVGRSATMLQGVGGILGDASAIAPFGLLRPSMVVQREVADPRRIGRMSTSPAGSLQPHVGGDILVRGSAHLSAMQAPTQPFASRREQVGNNNQLVPLLGPRLSRSDHARNVGSTPTLLQRHPRIAHVDIPGRSGVGQRERIAQPLSPVLATRVVPSKHSTGESPAPALQLVRAAKPNQQRPVARSLDDAVVAEQAPMEQPRQPRKPDIDTLAQQVYQQIRRQLLVDGERLGRF